MRLATWNVNSIKARLHHVTAWLGEAKPDVVVLQELKCVDEAFPREPIEDLGYNVEVLGQKTYNGVAILSRLPIEDVSRGLPGDDGDEQARYIEATVDALRVCGLYLPNGNPVGGDKFTYKLGWMDRLIERAKALLDQEEPFVMAGDFNVCPTDDDVYDPLAFADDALCRPESRARFRILVNLGLTDAIRAFNADAGVYTYWDYQRRAWERDAGLRIDHILLSPQATDRVLQSGVDKAPRGKEKASDHTPVWCELAQ